MFKKSQSRWRKDVKHQHYYVTNCYDELKSGEQAKQFDNLCGNFYEAAHIANSQEKYEYLMECIDLVKEQLTDDSNWGVHNATGSTKKLLSPFKVRGKGRPPVNRKIPIEEKIIKKQQRKKKKNEHEGKEIRVKEKIIKKKPQRNKKKKNECEAMEENTLQDQRGMWCGLDIEDAFDQASTYASDDLRKIYRKGRLGKKKKSVENFNWKQVDQ
ncbi:hypothetical protein Tco_0607638 [Tanacetum coccineum]